jgi:hypothetical protein
MQHRSKPYAACGTFPRGFVRRLSDLGAGLTKWVETAANYYAAAGLYENLSRLSDAELARRGLSRASLGRDVVAACENSDAPHTRHPGNRAVAPSRGEIIRDLPHTTRLLQIPACRGALRRLAGMTGLLSS